MKNEHEMKDEGGATVSESVKVRNVKILFEMSQLVEYIWRTQAKRQKRGLTVIAQVFLFSNAVIVALYSSLRMDRSAST
jgi:hypothetical protein